jgi:hypothetical protein
MPRLHKTLTGSAIASMLWAIPLYADLSDFSVFNNQDKYSAVLLQQGRVQLDADWNEPTAIQPGQSFGIFSFQFDPAAIKPVVGYGIAGGLAVGAAPDGTFNGDQGISVVVTPGLAFTAFGAEIAYGPFAGTVLSDIFRLTVQCPVLPCVSAGNLSDLNPQGGTFFLGIVAAPGFAFNEVTLEADIPRDQSGEPIGVVPNWQIAAITASAVPEPSTWVLLGTCLCCAAAIWRRELRT